MTLRVVEMKWSQCACGSDELRSVIVSGLTPFEWYYADSGNCQALEYFEQLTDSRKRSVLRLFQLMGNIGVIKDNTKFRSEGKQIYAFKPMSDRFLCFFFSGKRIIVTNAFQKKSKKLPAKEKERAIRAKKDYQERITRGEYYEK